MGVDVSASEFRIFKQCSKINTGTDVNFGISQRFSEYGVDSSKREGRKDKITIQNDSTEVFGIDLRATQTDTQSL